MYLALETSSKCGSRRKLALPDPSFFSLLPTNADRIAVLADNISSYSTSLGS
jgi:hypothetical protein